MHLFELLIGPIAESIFLAVYMIYVKQLKERCILFIIATMIEYLVLFIIFSYINISYFYVVMTATMFATLKLLYGPKSQITDVFISLIAYSVLLVYNALQFFIIANSFSLNYIIFMLIMGRLILFNMLYLSRKHLYKIQLIYKRLWNKTETHSVAFRCLNVILCNLLFVASSLIMIGTDTFYI